MSVGTHDDEAIAYGNTQGTTYEAYSPLGGLDGFNVLGDADVKAIAKAHGVSPAQVALRWDALIDTDRFRHDIFKPPLQVDVLIGR